MPVYASNQCKRKKQTRVVIRPDRMRKQIMTKDAFIREVRDAEAMLYHISKSILKNDSDCGDAVQETILNEKNGSNAPFMVIIS